MRRLLVVMGIAVGALLVPAGIVFATHVNMAGFAWSGDDLGTGTTQGGIGWISFSCDNTSSCAASNYGGNINTVTRVLSGYVWNGDNCDDADPASTCGVGWISFNPAEIADFVTYPGCGYPGLPCQPATYGLISGSYVTGWARAYTAIINAATAGGWSGWIKFSGTAQNSNPYGWQRTFSVCGLTGSAWGGATNGTGTEVIGWIKASGTAQNGAPYGVVGRLSGVCPPTATALAAVPDMCALAPFVVLPWTYSDPFGNPQASFQIQVADDPALTVNVRDSLEIIGSAIRECWVTYPGAVMCSNATGAPQDRTDFGNFNGVQYYWHVRVKNNLGAWSEWSPTFPASGLPLFPDDLLNPSDGPPPHPYPNEQIDVPLFAFVNQPVKLQNNSTDSALAGPGLNPNTFISDWTIDPPFTCIDPTVPPALNCTSTNGVVLPPFSPTISFPNPGVYNVRLTVTDDDGHDCRSASASIPVGARLPKWQEVIPKP